ncbi:MAG: HTTM domain-containing protein [Pseudomonadota bacterium]
MFEDALRATEILLALAFLQQSAEHVFGAASSRALFIPRAFLSLALLAGIHSAWALIGLAAHSLIVLTRYQGPFNGGSDKMALLTLYCVCLAHWLPNGIGQETAFAYLALQLVLSYFVSGQVKLTNSDWRDGTALQDVFRFSAYPVSVALRDLADCRRLLWCASWAVMIFEVLFPFSLLVPTALILALFAGAAFHLANAFLFGLNRFVWSWIAAYPSVIWLQGRILAGP